MLGLGDIDAQVFASLYAAGMSVPGLAIYTVAEPSLYLVLAWLIYALFVALRNARYVRVRMYVLALAAAVIARFGVAEALQRIIERDRPFETFGLSPLFDETSFSMPSGHAAFLFALAAGIYAFDRRAGLTLFAVAGLVSVARIMAGVHYPGDILVGAIVGVVVSSLCVSLARKTDIIPRVAGLKS